MTLDQALNVAQQCADQSGLTQAVTHDARGDFFVFTCPQEIDARIDAVIEPMGAASTNHA